MAVGRRSRSSLALLAAAVLLTAPSCFEMEEPVKERVQIRFLSSGEAVLTVAVSLRDFEGKELAQERVDEARGALGQERDVWSRRFEALGPAADRFVREVWEGRIVKIIRIGVIGDGGQVTAAPEAIGDGLRRFFADTLVNASFDSGEGWTELSFRPGPGSAATREQQDRMRDEMERWTTQVAAYLGASDRLYAYLDSRPDRAAICLGRIFEDLPLPGGLKERLEEITTDEKDLVEAVQASMIEVQGILAIPEGESTSIEELSRIVHDPFPAPLAVVAPWPVLDLEGFAPDGGRLLVPGLSLWGALVPLQGTWLSPDPLMIRVQHQGEGKEQDFDFNAVLRAGRRAEVLTANEIRRAIEDRLRPAAVYRVRWSVGEDADPRERSLGWDDFSIED
jgi:hypothetical protein